MWTVVLAFYGCTLGPIPVEAIYYSNDVESKAAAETLVKQKTDEYNTKYNCKTSDIEIKERT